MNGVLIENDHVNFRTNFPKLYSMLCDRDADTHMIKALVQTRKMYENEELSPHDADVAFGKAAVDRYVTPIIN